MNVYKVGYYKDTKGFVKIICANTEEEAFNIAMEGQEEATINDELIEVDLLPDLVNIEGKAQVVTTIHTKISIIK